MQCLLESSLQRNGDALRPEAGTNSKGGDTGCLGRAQAGATVHKGEEILPVVGS